MDVLRIIGGTPLCGSVAVGGAKNAVLPIMAAALLADERVALSAAPELTDVASMASLLERLGVHCERNGSQLGIQTIDRQPICAPDDLVRRMRASFCVLGPLLRAAAGLSWHCLAAAGSVLAASICICAVWRRSAPTFAWSAAMS